jgi:hypothetical protein
MARTDKVSACSFMASDMNTHVQYMRFEVLPGCSFKIVVFWNVMLCSLVDRYDTNFL